MTTGVHFGEVGGLKNLLFLVAFLRVYVAFRVAWRRAGLDWTPIVLSLDRRVGVLTLFSSWLLGHLLAGGWTYVARDPICWLRWGVLHIILCIEQTDSSPSRTWDSYIFVPKSKSYWYGAWKEWLLVVQL